MSDTRASVSAALIVLLVVLAVLFLISPAIVSGVNDSAYNTKTES